MRLRCGLAAGLAVAAAASLAGLAVAQQPDASVAVPPAPAIVSAPPAAVVPAAPAPVLAPPPPGAMAAPPPGLVQNQPPPDVDNGAAATPPADLDNGAAAAPPGATDTPPALPQTWVPGTTATLGVLDKVDGSVSQLSIPVGGQAGVGDMTVSVLACVSRPPGQIPDTAVFIDAQSDAGSALSPGFRGWMVKSAPGAAVAGNADEAFRVIACS
jgi:hypothetical protein